MTVDREAMARAVEAVFLPTCHACRRQVERVRGSPWHGDARICLDCFFQWYDPDDEGVDPTSPQSIGNRVRRNAGLGPLP